MKTRILLLTAVTLLLALTCGGGGSNCPEQVFLDPASCPAQLDAAKIAVDPYTNKPCLLSWKYVVEGLPWSYDGKYCDPDSDPMVLSATGGTLVNHNDGTYTISGPAMTIGQIAYPTMTLTDKPPAGDAYTRKGTVAIIAVKKNNPPSLCGGLP